MRLGFFGGSFDPIHNGHLILAEQCREQARLDRVLFVPANQSPLKSSGPQVSNKHRLEMLSLAIAGHPHFEVSTSELDRGGKSFTVESLQELKTEHPDSELFLLIGEDSLQSFAKWKQPEKICELALPLVCRRPHADSKLDQSEVDLSLLELFMDSKSLDQIRQAAIQSRLIGISSTDIRDRVSNDRSIRYLLPRAVEKYIETQRLYRSE